MDKIVTMVKELTEDIAIGKDENLIELKIHNIINDLDTSGLDSFIKDRVSKKVKSLKGASPEVLAREYKEVQTIFENVQQYLKENPNSSENKGELYRKRNYTLQKEDLYNRL